MKLAPSSIIFVRGISPVSAKLSCLGTGYEVQHVGEKKYPGPIEDRRRPGEKFSVE